MHSLCVFFLAVLLIASLCYGVWFLTPPSRPRLIGRSVASANDRPPLRGPNRACPVAGPGVAIVTTISVGTDPPPYVGSAPVAVEYVACPHKSKKQLCVLPLVKRMDPDTLVLLVDYDVLYSNWTAERLVETFDSFQTEIVMSAERFSYPECDSWKQRPSNMTLAEDNTINAGSIAGRARHIVPFLEHVKANYVRERTDQGFVQRFWLAHQANESKIKMDVGRILTTTMHDWFFWHTVKPQLKGEKCSVPWYYQEVCETETPWTVCAPKSQCTNTGLHRLCCNRRLNCMNAYDIDGCRVSQRHISKRDPVTADAMGRVRKGDWAEELWDFLPGGESFIYHGNALAIDMLGHMQRLLRETCEGSTS